MPKMTSRVFDQGDVKVVAFKGSITLGSGDVTMRNLIKDIVDQGNQKVVVDLGDVGFIDSTGLGELVAAYTTARGKNATLKLANLTKKIDDLMEITQLSSVFETYESLDEAVKSFA